MAENPLLIRPFAAFENPFASCRDQRTSGPKSRNGIKRGKPHHLTGELSLRNENGCDRRVRPHPPPRRSGGPPGCPHPGGSAPIFATKPTRTPTCCCRCRRKGHAAIAAIDSMAQASDGRRALADRADDMQFCADDFIWPTTGNDHAHWF